MSLTSFAFTYRGALVPLAATAVFAFPGGDATPLSMLAAIGVLGIGVALRISGVRALGGKARVHKAGARTLRSEGAFGHMRNPIYLGNLVYAAGLAALFASWTAAALVAAFLLTLYTVIILHEESVLLEEAGSSYRDYMNSVPRWLWRPRAASRTDRAKLTPWGEVWRLERGFVLAGVVCAVAAGVFSVRVSHLMPSDSPVWNLLGASLVVLVSAGLFVVVTNRIRRKRARQIAQAQLESLDDVAPLGSAGASRPTRGVAGQSG